MTNHTVLVSVVICTRNRNEDLRRCLESLQMYKDRDDVEVLVVDDKSSTSHAGEVVARYPNCRYFKDLGLGQGQAKNIGIREALGNYIAFTDDDVVVQPNWLENLIRNFDDPKVGYVSGQVRAWELETEAQRIFENLAILSKGEQRKTFDGKFFHQFRLRGVPVHLIGMGANSAAPKHLLLEVGLHDPLFGVGSLSEGSETGDLCYRILRQGYCAVFDPTAVVEHCHPRTRGSLQRKMYTYGKADTVTQTKFLLQYGDWRSLLDLVVNRPYRQAKKVVESIFGKRKTPFDLILCEAIGNWIGPWAYLRALWFARRLELDGKA